MPVAPVAPEAAGPAVPVLAVPRLVVTVVRQVAVQRVLLRVAPGPVEPVQATPQAIVPAVLVAPGAAVLVALRRRLRQRAATGRVGTRAPATRRVVLAVPVAQARAELVVQGRVVPAARATAVPRRAVPVVPAVPRLRVRVVPVRVVLVGTGRLPAVPGLPVPRPAREPQQLVVQEPPAPVVPDRLPECRGMPGRSEPRRPPVAQVPLVERVVPAVMQRMALQPTAVLRPEMGPWARPVQQAAQVEQVPPAGPAVVALPAVPVVLVVLVVLVDQVEPVE